MAQWKGKPYPLKVDIVLWGYSPTNLEEALDALRKEFKTSAKETGHPAASGNFNDPDRKGFGWSWRLQASEDE